MLKILSNKFTLPLIVAFMLLLAVFFSSAPPAIAGSQPVRSITVTGLAKQKIVPDEAHLVVTLLAVDMKIIGAKSLHDDKLRRLLKITEQAGIEEKKISTQHSNAQPVYEYEQDANGNGKQVFKGYQMQSTIDVTVNDIAKLGPLQDKILSAGLEDNKVNNYSGLVRMYYAISNPEKRRENLLMRAVENAKSKAENMAEASGSNIGRVLQINESGAAMPEFRMEMMKSAGSADAASAIAAPAGEQEIESSVTVTYELE